MAWLFVPGATAWNSVALRRVAGLAGRDDVVRCVATTPTDWDDMVLFKGNDKAMAIGAAVIELGADGPPFFKRDCSQRRPPTRLCKAILCTVVIIARPVQRTLKRLLTQFTGVTDVEPLVLGRHNLRVPTKVFSQPIAKPNFVLPVVALIARQPVCCPCRHGLILTPTTVMSKCG